MTATEHTGQQYHEPTMTPQEAEAKIHELEGLIKEALSRIEDLENPPKTPMIDDDPESDLWDD